MLCRACCNTYTDFFARGSELESPLKKKPFETWFDKGRNQDNWVKEVKMEDIGHCYSENMVILQGTSSTLASKTSSQHGSHTQQVKKNEVAQVSPSQSYIKRLFGAGINHYPLLPKFFEEVFCVSMLLEISISPRKRRPTQKWIDSSTVPTT